jgi:hypothetical protein
MTESKFRACHEPHLRDYPDCFQECGCDACEAPLFSEGIKTTKESGSPVTKSKPGKLKRIGLDEFAKKLAQIDISARHGLLVMDLFEEYLDAQLLSAQLVVDRLVAENTELKQQLEKLGELHNKAVFKWSEYESEVSRLKAGLAKYYIR